jgi:hypothetical protein
MRIARFMCSLMLAAGLLTVSGQSRAQVAVDISVRIAPPVLPVYVQPICPEPGYLWVPGYWAFGPDGYFWVPGTWVEPPEVGLLWTPGYWEWEGGLYIWHAGYWGPEVGYYGGIDYGFGYTGVGFYGGYWKGQSYYYNRAVTNVDVAVVNNTYNTTVVNNTTTNRVSFNGGPGGVTAHPTSREMAAEQQRHVAMTSEQMQHQQVSSANRTLLASVNHGRPDIGATVRPHEFSGRAGAESGKSMSTNRPPESPKETNTPRPNSDRPLASQPPNVASVNPALEQKHQRQLDQLRQQQAEERQRVMQKQQQEQQKLQQHAADDHKQKDAQRKQQQQLAQMEQKHEQQQQRLRQKQQQEQQRQQRPSKPQSPPKPAQNDRPASQQ